MSASDGRVLTFNGEIYNHPELRRTLEARGHVYRSETDSETLLHAHSEWGEDMLRRLRGMFAFAIWDPAARTLFAARDPLGIKPLSVLRRDGALALASSPRALLELPGVRAVPDAVAVEAYLRHGFLPGDLGAFRDVSTLPPGHALRWCDGRMETWRYWRPPTEVAIHEPTEAADAVRTALGRAVSRHLMADVPLSVFLSGGVDSTLIAALSGRSMPALCLGFEVPISDERRFAREAARALDMDLAEAVLREEALEPTLESVVEAHDEPFGLSAALPMQALCDWTAGLGAKAVLSGDGADELFAGYRHHEALAGRYARWRRATARQGAGRAGAALAALTRGLFDPLRHYRPHDAGLSARTRAALIAPGALPGAPAPADDPVRAQFPLDRGPVDAARRFDLAHWLPDGILRKVDRASMARGLEVRVPMLDLDLVELAFRIDPRLHADGGRKAVLKHAARGIVPPSMLGTRKKGFSAPLHLWLGPGARRQRMERDLLNGPLSDAGILRSDLRGSALARLTGDQVFQLYMLHRWWDRWAC